MDNASKALIMAGGIFIAVMIVTVAIYVFNNARDFASAANDQSVVHSVQSFNSFYQSLESPISGLDVLNVYNKAIDDYKDGKRLFG